MKPWLPVLTYLLSVICIIGCGKTHNPVLFMIGGVFVLATIVLLAIDMRKRKK